MVDLRFPRDLLIGRKVCVDLGAGNQICDFRALSLVPLYRMFRSSRIPSLSSNSGGPLDEQFRAAGFKGPEMPAFVKTIDHGLIAWMVQTLSAQENCMPEESAWGHPADSAGRATSQPDDILRRFEEVQASDVIPANDQNLHVDEAWPDKLRHSDVDDRCETGHSHNLHLSIHGYANILNAGSMASASI